MITYEMTQPKLDKEVVRQQCEGRWVDILASAGIDRSLLDGRHHPCPKCQAGEDRFRLIDADAGAVFCNQCGSDGIGDGFASIMWITGCKLPEAIDLAADAVGALPRPARKAATNGSPPPSIEDAYEWRTWHDSLAGMYCLRKPGVSADAIIAAGGRLAKHGAHTVFALPAIGETLDLAAPTAYINVRVDGAEFVDQQGKTAKTKICKGGKSGLLGLDGLQKLAAAKQAGTLDKLTAWKVEGVNDLLTLWSRIPETHRDRHIVLTSGAGTENPKWMASALAGVGRVNVIGDADVPGVKAAKEWASAIAAAGVEATTTPLPYEVAGDGGKDLRDWFNDGGDFDGLEKLVAEKGELATPAAAEKSEKPGKPPARLFKFGELAAEYPKVRPYVIDGLIREGESMNLVSGSKRGKSWMVHGLALSVVCNRPWFGHFYVAGGKVLLFDNELHHENLRYRIDTVAEAMDISPDQYRDNLIVCPLRGDLMSLTDLRQTIDAIEPGTFKLIIMDAKYRFGEEGEDENSNSHETRFYNRIDAIAKQTGAAIVLVHHSSKGDQSGKGVTDVGAGAGAQSRATDCHVALRQHQEDGAVTLDAAPRSFPPLESVALRWEFPVWRLAPDLDPSDLKPPPGSRNASQVDRLDDARRRILTILETAYPIALSTNGIVTRTREDGSPKGLGKDTVADMLPELVQAGKVTTEEGPPETKGCPIYKFADSPPGSASEPADVSADGGPLVSPLSPKGGHSGLTSSGPAELDGF